MLLPLLSLYTVATTSPAGAGPAVVAMASSSSRSASDSSRDTASGWFVWFFSVLVFILFSRKAPHPFLGTRGIFLPFPFEELPIRRRLAPPHISARPPLSSCCKSVGHTWNILLHQGYGAMKECAIKVLPNYPAGMWSLNLCQSHNTSSAPRIETIIPAR